MVCQFCFKIFIVKKNFVFHLRAVHKFGEPVVCPHCGKDDFMSRSPYVSHVKKCQAKNDWVSLHVVSCCAIFWSRFVVFGYLLIDCTSDDMVLHLSKWDRTTRIWCTCTILLFGLAPNCSKESCRSMLYMRLHTTNTNCSSCYMEVFCLVFYWSLLCAFDVHALLMKRLQ